ncbi:AzlD domain-containing protein [Geothermobacter hydrogeniphilus]|uniref:AzlD domain-containing protein n=1 Tax=Geothermobacter hydrogeniphilus TaxID=1969733 RepID=A0A2K2HC02_9BACT|nr:AzlD domain-containing protein [Geothermobacter hydrogeniphilus]PNU20763.1 AzlD domain-containing protein [Geothermobacter hydrogeniphilus]
MFPAIENQVFLAVGLAAIATYSLRLGGLLLASRFPKSGRFRKGMDALPGALLFSLVVPTIVTEGLWGVLATILTAAVVLRSHNTLVAMLVGMLVIYVARQFKL